MNLLLKDIAQLQSGVYLKAKEEQGEVAYLLGIKDFDDNFHLTQPSVRIDKKEVKEKYIVQKDHVLFSSRLVFNAFYLPDSNEVYVASNSFMLIKPNLEKVIPNYLRWFLNHPHTQQKLVQLAQGSSRMPYISQKKLETFSVKLPDLAIQKQIAAVVDLMNTEKKLRQKLINKREKYIQSILLNTLKNE